MIENMNSSVSALLAFQKKMNSTANNIANASTDGYKKSRVLFQERLNGGVDTEVDRVEERVTLTSRPTESSAESPEPSDVNLAEEIPQLMIAKAGYSANLKAVKVQEDMLGSLLDIMA